MVTLPALLTFLPFTAAATTRPRMSKYHFAVVAVGIDHFDGRQHAVVEARFAVASSSQMPLVLPKASVLDRMKRS